MYYKKSIGSIMLYVLSACSIAQTYSPFVENDKVWVLYYSVFNHETNQYDRQEQSFIMTGDTIIADKSYKKFYSYDNTNNRILFYITSMREEGRKVYSITHKGQADEVLLYDFNMNIGEIQTLAEYTDHNLTAETVPFLQTNEYIATSEGCLQNTHHLYPYLSVERYYSNEDESYLYETPIESKYPYLVLQRIGHISSPLGVNAANVLDCEMLYLKECRVNNSVIWQLSSQKEYEELLVQNTGIRTTNKTNNTLPHFFDLQGRRLAAPPARGVFIQDGRKVIQ